MGAVSESGESIFVCTAGDNASNAGRRSGEKIGLFRGASGGRAGDEGNDGRDESGGGGIPDAHASAGARRCAGVADRRGARVGNGGVCGGRGDARAKEGANRDWACPERAGRDGRMHAVAERIREECACAIHSCETTVLDHDFHHERQERRKWVSAALNCAAGSAISFCQGLVRLVNQTGELWKSRELSECFASAPRYTGGSPNEEPILGHCHSGVGRNSIVRSVSEHRTLPDRLFL